jgi:cytochrome c peroxidase
VLLGMGGLLLIWQMSLAGGGAADDHESQVPDERWKTPFRDEVPITFVNRAQNPAEWDRLKSFWNPSTEQVVEPRTGKTLTRKAVKVRVPLGLTSNPPVPAENPMTVGKWKLGKRLYFDKVLSSDGTVACASCHDPNKGFTDQSPFSTGIAGKRGGMSAPTVFNSAYNTFQFWDGRAFSLEDQSQGPVQNALEMFDGDGHAWRKTVFRLRANPDYVEEFKKVFGTLPTRDAIAKALATYERTVLSGNSLHDRAELAMRKRVDAEETGRYVLRALDYASVLKEAFRNKDTGALKALKLDPVRDEGKSAALAKSLVNGRNLFFEKARCSLCHAGDNFTDNAFHNLGVGVKDGKLHAGLAGRYGAQPTGHKDPALFGAFKTPTLRHLLGTGPYMHDGSEKTLEQVVDFYDRGGNVNEFLDGKMRDEDAERAWLAAREAGKEYKGPEVKVFHAKPIAAKKLNLSAQEKADLVLFLRALQGDAPDPHIGDPKKMP